MSQKRWAMFGSVLLVGFEFLPVMAGAANLEAEQFCQQAQQNRLTDSDAKKAAGWLDDEDPFVRALSEWAITMKVGMENNGQKIVHPGRTPPEWYGKWAALPGDAMLEADWCRQAVSAGIHRDRAKMLASVDAMIGRAERMAVGFERDGATRTTLDLVAARVDAMRETHDRLTRQIETAPDDLTSQRKLWLKTRRLTRDVAMANPALDFDQIVFIEQFAPHTPRNITRTFSWQHKPGGDIVVQTNLHPGGKVRRLLRGSLGPGHVRGFDLRWDADRIVFSHARQTHWPPAANTTTAAGEGTSAFELRRRHPPLKLFQIALDGTQLKQLTHDPYWNDFEPTYCPDGAIVFASDRCARSAECGPFNYDIANCNLYTLPARGGAVSRLTDSKDIDRYPHCLDNGLIAYTHWEYQERHFMEVHSLWTVRPDGTMSDALFKHHMKAPLALRDTRSIPDSQKLVSIATGHHTFAQGPVVTIDPRGGLNEPNGIRIVTPGVRPQEGAMAGRAVAGGGVKDYGGLYQTPYAISENCFLVSYAYARPKCTAPIGADSNGFAIYLIDTYGNKELIHRDPVLSCSHPMPLKKRLRPPLLLDRSDRTSPEATCYISDVHEGLAGVARGSAKYIRISQHVGWPLSPNKGMMPYMPGNAFQKQLGCWSWSPVRVIGTVEVAGDGSACFKAPADTALYFQVLDEHQMELRRMRSMVSLQQGEVRGCTGCHESQSRTPATTWRSPAALRADPQVPVSPPWGSRRLLGYEWMIQPIFDRHCVRCHGEKEPDGAIDLTGAKTDLGFVRSFCTLFGQRPSSKKSGKPLVSVSNRFSNSAVSKPKEFGSHRSPLIRVIRQDKLHKDEVKLSPTEWTTLVTWVDANAPYHDTFYDRRPTDGSKPRRNVTVELPPPFEPQLGRFETAIEK